MQISTVLPANLELLLKEKIKDTILYELRTGRALQTRAILRAKIEERLTAQINSLIPDLPENQKTLAINDIWMLILMVIGEMTEAGIVKQWKVSDTNESFFYISLPATTISPFKRSGDTPKADFNISLKPGIESSGCANKRDVLNYLKAGAFLKHTGFGPYEKDVFTMVYSHLWSVPVSQKTAHALLELELLTLDLVEHNDSGTEISRTYKLS